MRIGVVASLGRTLDAFFPHLVEGMRSRGHEVCAAAGTVAKLDGSAVIEGLTRRPSPRNFQAPRQLRAWSSSNDLDVVVTNTATASALTRLSGLATPVVYFCHGLHWSEPRASNAVFRGAERLLLRRTAGVICLNSDDEEWFANADRGLPRIRLRNGVGVPLREFPYVPTDENRRVLRILWAGEFASRKRPWLALDVAEQLLRVGVPVRLTMLGDGPLLERTRGLAARRGLAGHVHLPGRQPAAQPMTECHALVHTASWEGLPRVLLEGIATGRRSFALDAKGVRDVPHVIVTADTHELADRVEGAWRGDGLRLPPPPSDLSPDAAAGALVDFLGHVVGS